MRRTVNNHQRPRRFIALILALLIPLNFLVGAVAVAADAVNLVKNPSLEEGTVDATCFKRAGWGTEGNWNFVAGRLGGRAVSVTLQGHTAGDRKLLQEESAQCAPAVVPGRGYTIQVWYKSTAQVSLTLFRHSAAGWSYWGDIAAAGAGSGLDPCHCPDPHDPRRNGFH